MLISVLLHSSQQHDGAPANQSGGQGFMGSIFASFSMHSAALAWTGILFDDVLFLKRRRFSFFILMDPHIHAIITSWSKKLSTRFHKSLHMGRLSRSLLHALEIKKMGQKGLRLLPLKDDTLHSKTCMKLNILSHYQRFSEDVSDQ